MNEIRELIDRFNLLWANDFYRGVIVTLALIFGVCLVYFILKMIFWLKFRWRRCRTIMIEMPAGKVMVSENALTAALQSELAKFRQLVIRKIAVYRKKNKYRMVIFATLSPDYGSELMPQLFMAVKPLLTQRMEDVFGIKDFDDMTIRIEEFIPEDESERDDIPQIADGANEYREYPGR